MTISCSHEWYYLTTRALVGHSNHIIYMLIYVYDIIVASSLTHAIRRLFEQIQKEFAIKDLGDVHYFLGIEVQKKPKELILTQRKYICDLL